MPVTYRRKVIQMVSSNKNRIIRTLEDGNVKLSSVLSDTSGKTGTELIEMLCDGKELTLQDIEDVRHGRCHHTSEEIPGLHDRTLEDLIAEIGLDMTVYPSAESLCKWAASRTKGTFSKERFERLSKRKGGKKALIAVGHSILKAVHYVISTGGRYHELGEQYVPSKIEKKRKDYLKSELQKLGYEVSLIKKKD